MSCINEEEIRKTIETFKPGGQLFEVRIHDVRKRTISGYFRDADKLIEALQLQERSGKLDNANVFYTINSIKEECAGRQQFEQFLAIDPTTSDNDVTAYSWLLIDMDPKRPAGTSSTNEQLEKAKLKARTVYSHLRNRGFPAPIIALSGNGYHLQYKITLAKNDENKALIKRTLEALDLMFSDEDVEIDTSVFNPARICKLYGTKAQKGSDTERQPHRMSKLIDVPSDLEPVGKIYLEQLAETVLPKMQPKAAYNNYNPRAFDIEEWMDRYGIHYKAQAHGDYTKYVLDCCPFDSTHKAPDSMITRGRNGEIGFRCLHNSCSGKRWQDVRVLFEPDAYEKEYIADDGHIDAGWKEHKNALAKMEMVDGKPDTSKLDEPAYYTAADILQLPKEEHSYIATGILGIDRKIGGLERGAVSVVSGLRGGSKSTILTQIALNAVQNDKKVLFHSFEMRAQTVLKWFMLMAAGKANVKGSKIYENYYSVKERRVETAISEWLGNRLRIYNNDFGNNYKQLYNQLWHEIKTYEPDLVILDNLMALDISDLDSRGDLYQEQTAFVNSIVTLAKQGNTHIIFVAHPRKSMGFLRLDDISGSANIANAVTNAFIVHRNNEDFRRLTNQMFKWPASHAAYTGTNVIEIAKDRNYGVQDIFVPLWYEKETKRLKNYQTESFHYGWEGANSSGRWIETDKDFHEVAGDEKRQV